MNSIESVTVAPARVFKALSSDDLRRCAPSVFAEQARPGVSARYTFVSTAQVAALLGVEGWEPVRASEQHVRLEDRLAIRWTRFVSHAAPTWRRVRCRSETLARNDPPERP